MLCCIHCNAQSYWENYELISTRQGLPHNVILSLLQDDEGYLWIGTYNGLCRYDGHAFDVCKNVFGKTQSNNWFHAVETIYEDNNHNIWIGSRGGMVSCFSKPGQAFHFFRQGGNPGKVNCFYQAPDGRVWTGHENGLGVIRNDSVVPVSAVCDAVLGITSAAGGAPVIITRRQLLLYDEITGNVRSYIVRGLPQQVEIYACAGRGNIWLLHTSAGIFAVDIRGRKIHCRLPYMPARPVYLKPAFSETGYIIAEALVVKTYDSSGRCTDSLHISDEAWANNREIHNCLTEDRSGIVWLGTNSGLYKVDRRRYRFRKYLHNNAGYFLGDNYVRSLYANGDDLWVGTKNGCVNRLTYDIQKQAYVFRHRYPLLNRLGSTEREYTVNCMTAFGDYLFAGGESGLLYMNRLNGRVFRHCRSGVVPGTINCIWALYADSSGNIWMGTQKDGLCILAANTDRLYCYNSINKGAERLAAGSVWTIYKDRQNSLWLGTDSGLYCVRNPGDPAHLQFARYILPVKDNMPADVWHIIDDRDNNLWLGTTGHGLFRLDAQRQTYTSYERPGNVISGLAQDASGNLWISTANGLYSYHMAGSRFIAYDEQDGLLSNEFNYKAVAVAPTGALFFGNKTGMISFKPEHLSPEKNIDAPVRITSVSVNNRDTTGMVYRPEQLSLRYDQNDISIGFAIIDFTKPLNHRYRYCLAGFDQQWHETPAGQPRAAYTNLPPGNYRFVVKASADGSNWSGTQAALVFVIRPAFWQTFSFRISVIVLLLFTAAWLVYARIRFVVQRERKKYELEKEMASLELRALQAQMNPHFICNAINSIQHFILHNDVLQANDYLSRFARLMRLFLESAKARYISLEHELELLHLYLQLEQLRFDDRFSYSITVQNIPDTGKIGIPSALVQPFVENAIHHGLMHMSGRGVLLVSFELTGENSIHCIIDDNGIGREKAAALRVHRPRGHVSRGMQLIAERVKTYNFIDDHDISVQIIDKAVPQQGTRVVLVIPVTPLPNADNTTL